MPVPIALLTLNLSLRASNLAPPLNGELLIGRQGVGAEAEVAGDEAGVQEGVAEREEDSHIAPL